MRQEIINNLAQRLDKEELHFYPSMYGFLPPKKVVLWSKLKAQKKIISLS